MVWKCFADDIILASARDIALRLARSPTSALVTSRQLIDSAITNTDGGGFFGQHAEREARAQRYLGDTWEFEEGRRAFLEKRKVNFVSKL